MKKIFAVVLAITLLLTVLPVISEDATDFMPGFGLSARSSVMESGIQVSQRRHSRAMNMSFTWIRPERLPCKNSLRTPRAWENGRRTSMVEL